MSSPKLEGFGGVECVCGLITVLLPVYRNKGSIAAVYLTGNEVNFVNWHTAILLRTFTLAGA